MTKKRNGFSVPFLFFLFLSDFFIFFSFCVVQSMSMQYFSQRYLTATGGSILVEGDTPICSSSSWSESNHRRKVGSDTPAACANSDLSFDLYAIFCLFCCFDVMYSRSECARKFRPFPEIVSGSNKQKRRCPRLMYPQKKRRLTMIVNRLLRYE